MGKRFWSVAIACALVAGVFSSLPASAQEAPAVAIPEVVQIDDPVGDANGLNDQDNAYNAPPLVGEGDHVLPADVGTATDILKVWFTNTGTDVSLNIQLEGNPSALAYDTYFRFSSNMGEGAVASDTLRGCLQWIASVNGAGGAYNAPTEGNLTDKCNVGDPVFTPLTIAPADTGFVMTITFPRSYSPLLEDGALLTAPFGVSRVLYANGLPPSPAAGSTAAFVTMDNTQRGTDYTISSGGPVVQPVPPKEEPPGKADPPGKGKKKGCGKGKGKQKGACPGKKPPAPAPCPAYVPGEQGAEATTSIVTDAATEEAPVVFEATAAAGGPNLAPAPVDETSNLFQNIQVDSANPEAGLYVKFEFPEFHDYDFQLKRADGSTAASSGDAQVAPGEGLGSGSPEGGWEAGTNYEMVMGIRSADCAGYTAQMIGFLTYGGDVKLSMWLGEIKADPVAPPSQESAMEMFYRVMGL